MPFPQTFDDLRNQGYKFEGEGMCRGCGADIEWWVTPKNKKMPMDFGTATPHWSTCPNRDDLKTNTSADHSTSKITPLTLNMDWLKEQAKNCHCTVCKKLTGR